MTNGTDPMTTAVRPAVWQRERSHLVAMCDGKKHGFFDHTLANRLRQLGLIQVVAGGYYQITEEGKKAVINNGY